MSKMTKVEYQAKRAQNRQARLAKIEAERAARHKKKADADEVTVLRILTLIDRGGGRPLRDVDLRRLKGSHLRCAAAEAARADVRLVCLDGAYSRFQPEALSGRA